VRQDEHRPRHAPPGSDGLASATHLVVRDVLARGNGLLHQPVECDAERVGHRRHGEQGGDGDRTALDLGYRFVIDTAMLG
jgi:hypothetical protein